MRRWALAVVTAATATGSLVAACGAPDRGSGEDAPPADTAKVERGELSAMVSVDGTLTYRARPDGSPYSVVDQARGIYTEVPYAGDEIGCGDVLYRVDDDPVLLLCGTVPAYRRLRLGDRGQDVRKLNRNLRRLGYEAAGARFTRRTRTALEGLQDDRGAARTGALDLGDAVFLPEPVRIAKVTAQLGGPARPGAPVLKATSGRLTVQVSLEPSQRGVVEKGDRAQVTLPGNTPVPGRVEGFGRVVQVPAGPDGKATGATIPAFVRLGDPGRARGLDQAPVQVDITTEGVQNALSVPVTALVGRSGGGVAVEVVRPDGRRDLVAVTLGLFDTGGGRVQVEGDLRAGDSVVVPSQ